jgi:hypothetical protein
LTDVLEGLDLNQTASFAWKRSLLPFGDQLEIVPPPVPASLVGLLPSFATLHSNSSEYHLVTADWLIVP